MHDWIFIINDSFGTKRVALIMDFLAFLVSFIFSWYILFRFFKKSLGKRADAYAKKLGFKCYSDLANEFTNRVIFIATNFLVFVLSVYFFTHLMDIKETYQCAMLGEWIERHMAANNPLINETINLSRFNFTLVDVNTIPEARNTS